MVTLLVHVWLSDESEEPVAGVPPPPPLRGVVSGGASLRPRPFSGPDELVLQLKGALADRLQSEQCRARTTQD